MKKALSILCWLMFVCFLALGICTLWSSVWDKAAVYEETRPENIIADYAEEFADGRAYEYCRNKKESGYVYTISIEGVPTADVSIVPSGEQGLVGFDLYTLGAVKGRLTMGAFAQEGVFVFFGEELASPVEIIEIEELKGLEFLEMNMPRLCRYEIGGLLELPKVYYSESVDGTLSGIKCRVPDPSSEITALTQLCEDFAVVNAKFLIGEESWYTFKSYLYPGVPLIKDLAPFANSWYTEYISYDFGEKELSDIRLYKSGLASGRLKYRFTVHGRWRDTDYDVDYNCYFKKNDAGEWKICDLRVN